MKDKIFKKVLGALCLTIALSGAFAFTACGGEGGENGGSGGSAVESTASDGVSDSSPGQSDENPGESDTQGSSESDLPAAGFAATAEAEEHGEALGSGVYAAGEEVTFTAKPDPGYVFIGWFENGVSVSDDAEYTFSMPERDVVCTAKFERMPDSADFLEFDETGKIVAGFKDGVENVKTVVIPEGVEEICEGAFYWEDSVETVIIPDSVKKIGEFAFYKCSALREVKLSAGLTEMGQFAFSGCDFSQIVVPGSLAEIPARAFYDCTELEELAIEEGVEAIGIQAFEYCTSLQSVAFPEGMETIGGRAFAECENLREITLGGGLKTVAGDAFSGCEPKSILIDSLSMWCALNEEAENAFFRAEELYLNGEPIRELAFPAGTTRIRAGAFRLCPELEKITLPEGLTEIGDRAFLRTALKQISFPDSLTAIGASAFAYCNELSEAVLPVGVNSLGSGIFSDCTGLKTARIESGTIPSSAFTRCTNLTTVVFSDGVEVIGDKAFERCVSLTDIAFGEGLRSIGESAFTYCVSLTDISLPDGVREIGSYAFRGCTRLERLVLPTELEYFGYDVFNTSGLKLDVSDLPGWFALEMEAPVNADWELYVQGERVTRLVVPEQIRSIGKNLFARCVSLEEITFPEGVTDVGYQAFSGCINLEKIVLPASIARLEAAAFAGTEGVQVHIADLSGWCAAEKGRGWMPSWSLYSEGELLTALVLPEGVSELPDRAFAGCSGIRSAVISERVQRLGSFVFSECTALESVSFSGMLSSIPLSTFARCRSLRKIDFPQGLTELGDTAFFGCGFSEISVPDSVTKLGDYLFSGCASLRKVTFGASVQMLPMGLFYGCSALEEIVLPQALQIVGDPGVPEQPVFVECSALSDVYYGGTAEEWEKIAGHEYVEEANENVVVWFYSETEPPINAEGTAYDGNYWHYAPDGVTPVVWELQPDVAAASEGTDAADGEQRADFDRFD